MISSNPFISINLTTCIKKTTVPCPLMFWLTFSFFFLFPHTAMMGFIPRIPGLRYLNILHLNACNHNTKFIFYGNFHWLESIFIQIIKQLEESIKKSGKRIQKIGELFEFYNSQRNPFSNVGHFIYYDDFALNRAYLHSIFCTRTIFPYINESIFNVNEEPSFNLFSFALPWSFFPFIHVPHSTF